MQALLPTFSSESSIPAKSYQEHLCANGAVLLIPLYATNDFIEKMRGLIKDIGAKTSSHEFTAEVLKNKDRIATEEATFVPQLEALVSTDPIAKTCKNIICLFVKSQNAPKESRNISIVVFLVSAVVAGIFIALGVPSSRVITFVFAINAPVFVLNRGHMAELEGKLKKEIEIFKAHNHTFFRALFSAASETEGVEETKVRRYVQFQTALHLDPLNEGADAWRKGIRLESHKN